MRPIPCAIALGALLATVPALAGDDDPCDLLRLKGPGGVAFDFCRVRVGGGSGPLAGQSFVMGAAAGEFRTPPTAVVVGGGFADGKGRYYYLGRTEVTNAQYAAVMGLKPGPGTEDYPAASHTWFDFQQFIDRLNQHLLAHELKSLPASGGAPGYVRMPTEEEWEFAARGGTSVTPADFDADTPYDALDDEYAAFEWFAGPESSHNKVQKAGQLLPNQLGLHDMLGNVQEMTSSLYRVEYYQGRAGGFTARGGHFLTEEGDLSSARRTEEPFFIGTVEKGMKPNQKPTLGLRLALGVPVMTGQQAIADLERDWKGHRSGDGATMPAAVSVADTSTKESVPANEALKRLERIREALEKAGLGDRLKNDLEGTRSSLLDMVAVRRKADEDSARVWVKIACERGMYLTSSLKGYELTRDAPTENLRKRAEQFKYNIDSGLQNYGEIMTELGKLPKEAVLGGFDAYRKDMQGKLDAERKAPAGEVREQRISDLSAQLARIEITAAHYARYEKERRLDAGAWSKDYLN
ncbi:MAG: formylglycine-generating enzyme family protein [Succinivibrionaceae bacterium]|nr:formylglycine-generating enzyme family protein [Succinivibrionaceae bacterium]